MKSFGLLKTNVGLTSNVKIMIGEEYELYLDSIESNSELSMSKYKGMRFNKDSKYDSLLPIFYNNLPSTIAFDIKYDDDVTLMYSDFKYQYDDTYNMGSMSISNKDYEYDYEYFAPLYININNIPKQFIIFRLDGQGIIDSNKDNFREEILDNMKCVTYFNLTNETSLGKWLDNSFLSNKHFPSESLFFDFRSGFYSQWNGIDYINGGFSSISKLLSDELYYSNNFHELEKSVLNNFRDNNLVYPNILNLSFMFNDTPSTKSNSRKWSINRYLGFYIDDIIVYNNVTPYNNIKLKSEVDIVNNMLSIDGITKNIEPFIPDFTKRDKFYLEISGKFFEIVKKYTEEPLTSIVKKKTSEFNYEEVIERESYFEWKVLSSEPLANVPNSEINNNHITISDNNIISFTHSGHPLIEEVEFAKRDIWLIEIDNRYHKIGSIIIDGVYHNILITDYGFISNSNSFKYFTNLTDSNYTTTIPMDEPFTFKVFYCDITDIKELDSNIVNTQFARYEQELDDSINNTEEPKLYLSNYNSKVLPYSSDEYKLGDNIVNIPSASEYTASGESFKIDDGNLTTLWRKNQIGLKWGYKGSLSAYDYPYLLNNSLHADENNRTISLDVPYVSQMDRTLDYFYTLSKPLNNIYNYQSLNIYREDTWFDYSRYLSMDDYFQELFGNYVTTVNSKNIINKYSTFNTGDNISTNSTLFRGIKFSIYKVNNISYVNNSIDNISTTPTSDFDEFKFSILFTKNNDTLSRVNENSSKLDIKPYDNKFKWRRVREFSYDIDMEIDDLFIFEDMIYKYIGGRTEEDKLNPEYEINPFHFSWFNNKSIYFDPDTDYVIGDIIYHHGVFYEVKTNDSLLIWSKFDTGSTSNIPVFYAGNTYNYAPSSVNIDNGLEPPNNPAWRLNTEPYNTLLEIQLYDDTIDIIQDYYIIDDVIYNSGGVPIYFINGSREHYIGYDTNLIYRNNVINFNDIIYFLDEDIDEQVCKLDNGIDILINFNHKNIIINIYCNDGTYTEDEITSIRENMYNEVFGKVNGYNFCLAINNLNTDYGFINPVRYIIIDGDEVNMYDIDNITHLSYIIQCDMNADIVQVKTDSKIYKAFNIPFNIIKPNNIMENSILPDFSYLENFNATLPIGVNIETNKSFIKQFNYYHGLSDYNSTYLYRYSGPYEPIFNNIQLFEFNPNGNFKFDTTLTEFGLSSERIISKVNRRSNILKLKDSREYNSIFPIYDEFGYTTVRSYIFKSTWDLSYYVECIINNRNA